jgi:hypothetical protein
VFRPGSSKPVVLERLLKATGKNQLAQRPLDLETIQVFLLRLAALVAEFGGGLADFASLYQCLRKCPRQQSLGGLVVSLHVRRRKRQLRSNSLEPVPERIRIQLARFGRIVAYA